MDKFKYKLFFERLQKIYSENDYDLVLEGFNSERVTSFRVNTLKSDCGEIENFLGENKIEYERVDFLDWVYVLDKKDEFFLKGSRIFYDGKIYVQWIASMIPALVLRPVSGEKILDVTAAPWSKTTQICAMMKNIWEITACEQNQIRFDKLAYNIKLQWCEIIKPIKSDANKLKDNIPNWYFDKILFDAPCSAEWRINLKNEKTYWFWSQDNILKKQKVQLEILENIIPLLKKWWTLLYSTCTLAPEENEEVIDYICEKYWFEIKQISLNFEFRRPWINEFGSKKYNKEISNTLRILPSDISEGFYVAKLLKK